MSYARARVVILALLVLLVTGGVALLADTSGEPAAAAGLQRLFVPGVASDSSPALLACDPTDLTAPSFTVEDRSTTLEGFDGQVFNGLIYNNCSVPVTALTASAATADASGNDIGTAFFHPSFGVIPPGGVSPFFVVVPPGSATVTGIGYAVLRYTPLNGPIPDLRVLPGPVTTGASGVQAGFTVVNTGTATAAIPRIVGRLQGANCHQPDVIEYLQDAAPLAPGARTSGTLTIPDACGGIPQMWAGADMPDAAAQPAGFSLRAASVSYAGTTLRLVAKLCNNTAGNLDNVPLSARFTGTSGATTLSFTGVGFFPAQACAPLIAAIPGAPAGLTFSGLTGTASPQVEAASMSGGVQVDPEVQQWRPRFHRPSPNSDPDDVPWWNPRLRKSSSEIAAERARQPPPDPNPPSGYPTSDGVYSSIFNDQVVTANPFVLVSIVYNQNTVPIASAQYSIIASAENASGTASAAVVITDPPDLPPLGWGIATTPLTDGAIVGPPDTTFFLDAQGFVP
jgi:hypothetical protein